MLQLIPRMVFSCSFIGDDEKPDIEHGPSSENLQYTYSHLKDIDPAAAKRIHPNDQRKVRIPFNMTHNNSFNNCLILAFSKNL